MEQYTKAQGYAFKASPSNYKDLVHDAYVLWHDKTGENLFERGNGTVISVVKNVIRESWNRRYFIYEGEKHLRSSVSKDSFEDDYEIFEDWNNPHKELELKELQERLEDGLSPRTKLVLDGLSQGYKKHEVGEAVGISHTTLTKEVNIIQKRLNTIIN
jgi:DNA-binding NarL/FixJ family response regulator